MNTRKGLGVIALIAILSTVTSVFGQPYFGRGDFNFDDTTNLVDINPFVQAIVDTEVWQQTCMVPAIVQLIVEGEITLDPLDPVVQWIGGGAIFPPPPGAVWLIDLLTSEIDPLPPEFPGDPVTINLLDIPAFVELVAGGGELASVPEPGTIGLLVVSTIVLMRRPTRA